MQAKLGLIALGVIGTSMQFTGLRVQAQTALPPIVIETQGPAGAQGAPGGDVQDTDQQAAPDADPSTAIDGYVAESSSTGTKTNTPLREIPQSVSVVTRDQIEDRGVETLGEAITYSAGVTVSPYGLDTRCDQFVIRGFEQNTTGVYRDGLRLPTFSFNCFRMEPYGVDHVDIMRGPTSTLFGLNNPGGLVNVVSKMPTEQAFGEVWASYGTHENKQTGFDVGGPLDSNGKVLYRITGVLRDSETQVDFVEDDRVYIAPALTFKPSDATTFTILSHYQKDKSGDTFQLLPLEGTLTGSPFGQLPRSRFLGEPDFSGRDSEEWSIGYMLDHKVQPGITFRQNLRYDHLDLEYNTLYGAGQLVGTPLLLRFAQQADQSLDLFQVDNQLQFDSRFERVENTLLIGADYSHFSGQSQLGFAAVGNSADPTLPVFNPFNPSYGQFFFINTQTFQPVETIPVFQDREQTQEQFGIYVQDQVKFDKHWVVTLNGRYDWVTSEFKDAATDLIPVARTQEKEDEAFTGRIGLGYLFDNGLTPYVSYSTSFFPVGLLGTAAGGGLLEPEESEQYEVGLKFQPNGFKSYATISAFDLTKQNHTVLATNQIDYLQTGEINIRGVELEVALDFDNGWRALGAVSFWDPEITADEANVGNRPEHIPETVAALWVDYTFRYGMFQGLGLGAGVRYVGETFGDNANRLEVPSYTLVDAGVRYEWDQWKLSFNVNNVFDEEYVGTCGSIADPGVPGFSGYDYCSFGEGRTATLRVGYRW